MRRLWRSRHTHGTDCVQVTLRSTAHRSLVEAIDLAKICGDLEEGVLALMAGTGANAERPGHTRSEKESERHWTALFVYPEGFLSPPLAQCRPCTADVNSAYKHGRRSISRGGYGHHHRYTASELVY